MKEKGIIWNGIQSKGRGFYKTMESWLAVLSRILADSVCSFLFVLSARLAMPDVLSWKTAGIGYMLRLYLCALAVSLFVEAVRYVPTKYRKYLVATAVTVVVCLVGRLIIGQYGIKLWMGMAGTGYLYMDQWSQYYYDTQSNWYADGAFISEALNWAFAIVLVCLSAVAKVIGKNLVMMVIPIGIFILELLVGYSPSEKVLFLFFLGMLLSNASSWVKTDMGNVSNQSGRRGKAFFGWIAVCVGACLLYGVVHTGSSSQAKEILTHAEDVKQWANELVSGVDLDSMPGGISSSDEYNKKILTNERPVYNNETVMTIELQNRPEGNLYLRGFCGGNYKDGRWDFDTTRLERICRERGLDFEEMKTYIQSLGVKKVCDMYGASKLSDINQGDEITVVYEKGGTTRVYFPYFIELSQKGISIDKDGAFRKNKNDQKVSGILWNGEGDYFQHLDFSENAPNELESCYREYVEDQYTKVPYGLRQVAEVAKEIQQKLTGQTPARETNELRVTIAKLVAEWMEENTTYSLDLPSISGGMDPIEFFLRETRSGYCMHYASASVMILRKLGVPARYASGYLVETGSIARGKACYYSNIKDSSAHAWAEIYLDSIGWVPIEVTKGKRMSMEINEPVVEVVEFEQPTPTETVAPSDVSKEAASPEPGNDPRPSSRPDDEKKNHSQEENLPKWMMFVLKHKALAAVVVVVVVMASFGGYFVWTGRKASQRRLRSTVRKKKTRRAIRMMNRRIYQCVYKNHVWRAGNVDDEQYLQTLKEKYPNISPNQWEQYMDIVKAAAFSKGERPVEDMEYCERIYRSIFRKW